MFRQEFKYVILLLAFQENYPEGRKTMYMFLFLFGKAKHYLDLDTYKEICSTRSQSKGLSLFLFQLFSIWHTFIKRKYHEVFPAPLAGRRARASTDKNDFLAKEWCGHGHTLRLRITDKIFSCWGSVKKSIHVIEGRKCLKCLKGGNKQLRNQCREKWCDSWRNIQLLVRALIRFLASMSAWNS